VVRSISATAQGAPTRTTTLHVDAGDRATAITDPDGAAVWFAYPESGTPRRMMGQRDRRGTWTWYEYDSAGKLARALTHLESEPNPAADVDGSSSTGGDSIFRHVYDVGRGRLSEVDKLNLGIPDMDFHPNETTREYDASGNVDWSLFVEMGDLQDQTYGVTRDKRARSYYGADERLRYFHERDMRGGPTVKEDGLWEEYRYDPLGRRILVNTRTADLCRTQSAFQCASATTRMVWAGDQLLWEIRRPSESPGETAGPPEAYGTVGYTHGGGLDRPLVITKDGQSILPHQNWRGQFSRGTYADGAASDCAPGQTTNCQRIPWPGWRTTAWHAEVKEPTISVWFGGLVDDMRDASGQMYRRNRYYDPATGQFTQQDPIGIAGGLNSYGFAEGDPVTYSDPYGLEACDKINRADCSKSELIMLGVADRLAPVAPALNTLTGIILIASPDPMGEGVLIVGGMRYAVRVGDKLLEGRRFNPFRGRTAQEIEERFLKKGFEPRGPDPVGGRGGYVNPRSGRSYHIDEANSFNEPPHVDVNRPKGYKGPLDKRKLDM
jgi:RHS repeat-associated protein